MCIHITVMLKYRESKYRVSSIVETYDDDNESHMNQFKILQNALQLCNCYPSKRI